MIQTKVTKLAQPFKLRFVEEADVVKEMVEKEYEKLAPTIEAKGFRKGKVPRDVAEKQKWFNKFEIYRPIFDEIYKKAIEQEKFDVVDARDFEVMGLFEDGSPLVMQCIVYFAPTILSFDINDVNVQEKHTDVTEEMVNEQIKIAQSTKATFTNAILPEYQVKKGDIMFIDYTGRIDGKEFKGGSAKAFKFIIGETKFIEGFEDQIKHLKAGETRTISVTFPADYFSKELQNKAAEFEIHVHKIEVRTIPTIEDLAKEEEKTVEDYKQSKYNKLIEDHAKIDKDGFESDVLSGCVKAADIEPIPDAMIQYELANEWNQLLYRLGTTEEEHLKKNPQAKDAFFAQRHQRLEKTIQVRIFLEYVCTENKIEVSTKEVHAFIDRRVKQLQKTDEEAKSIRQNLLKEQNYKASESAVKQEKAATFLVDEMIKKNANESKA